MWPLGHAAVGYLCYSLGARRGTVEDLDVTLLVALAIGTQLPDLADKPLAWYLEVLPAGRTLSHTLFLIVPVSVLAILFTRRYGRQAIGVALALGMVSHVLLDAVPAVWEGISYVEFLFWPLFHVEGYEDGPPGLLVMFRESLSDPWFLLEFVLAGVALVAWRDDGYPALDWALRRVPGDRAAPGSERSD